MKHSVKNNSQKLLHCRRAFSITNDESTFLKKASWVEGDFWEGGKNQHQAQPAEQGLGCSKHCWVTRITPIMRKWVSIPTASGYLDQRCCLVPILDLGGHAVEAGYSEDTTILCSRASPWAPPCPAGCVIPASWLGARGKMLGCGFWSQETAFLRWAQAFGLRCLLKLWEKREETSVRVYTTIFMIDAGKYEGFGGWWVISPFQLI